MGTDPAKPDTDGDRIPDGQEKESGMDPLAKEPLAIVEEEIRSFGPFPDGENTEWKLLPYYYVKEPAGDGQKPSFDLTIVFLNIRNGRLNILTQTERTPWKKNNTFFDLLIDMNNDHRSDMDFAFFLSRPAYPWKYLAHTGVSHMLPEIKGGMNRYFELSIPLSEIGADNFAVLPLIRDMDSESNLDEWRSWIDVDVGTFSGIEHYELQTDLRADDADSDGIPDRYELQLDLNPRLRNDKQDMKLFGPFIDGRDTEWHLISGQKVMDDDLEPSPQNYDIHSYNWLIKDDRFCLAVFPKKPLPPSSQVIFDVLVDENGDFYTDLEFAFYLSNPAQTWQYVAATGKSFFPDGVESEMGRIIEISIPLEYLPNETFSIYPILRNPEEGKNYEEAPHWIQVTSDKLLKKSR